jgi:hypothetical protein
LQLILAGW